MAEIIINIAELNSYITKLQALRSKCISNQIKAPKTVGGGQTVNELEAIASQYRAINAHLETLIGNTISFLGSLRDSYVSSDQKASEGIGS